LRQVLLNLLGNAIKFTEEGEVCVRVDLDPSDSELARVRFTVSDTGIGIPAEKQQVIFSPFEQADRSTTRKYGGTGLGLAISTQLVRLMHGTIEVDSPWIGETGRPVRGTAFHFTITFGSGTPPEPAEEEASATATRALCVLVAEDNSVNQMLASRLLQKLGHSVLGASNGDEAVRLFDRETPDLVLMDVQMPVMDGFEATSAIRARDERSGRHTPIIALTAHALQGYREECLRAGMDDYLTKPIKIGDLARAIARATTIRPSGDSTVPRGYDAA
jgi:CheY-like chemotaxis protein